MKNKGFTLVELLVVLVIVIALFGLVFGGINRFANGGGGFFDDGDEYVEEYIDPAAEQLAEQRRANDLKERELNLKEAELKKVEQ